MSVTFYSWLQRNFETNIDWFQHLIMMDNLTEKKKNAVFLSYIKTLVECVHLFCLITWPHEDMEATDVKTRTLLEGFTSSQVAYDNTLCGWKVGD